MMSWAIEPASCQRCSVAQSVCWYGESSRNAGHMAGWGTTCLMHAAVDSVAMGRSTTYLIVVEDPDVDADAMRVRIYQDPVTWIAPGLLTAVVSSFDNLGRARKIWDRSPGEWRIERRPDGSVWLPWDPTSWHRSGDSLPLVRRVLRGSKYARSCTICCKAMGPGPAWRPQPGQGASWGPKAMTETIACDECVEKAGRALRPALRIVSE